MKNKGFTLVELLSVIVIMGIILLVAIPSVFGISKTIKDNMYCTKVHNLESAAKLYGSDYNDDFDDKGYIKVDVKTIIDNNLYKKETDDCTLGDEDKGCVVDPRDESVMDNKTITIVKTGSRFYAYYDFSNEEDIVLCEGKKETDKFKHYDVALDNQGATYPGTTIVRDVVFGHEMPNIEVPRREYKVRLIDEYNHIDRTETIKYTFRGYFAAKNGGVKYYDESGKNVHYYNLPDGRPLYAVWTDKSINLPKQTLTGYEFRGWFTSRTGEDFIMQSGNYTPTSDITLYARWIPKVSTITFDNQSATVEGTKKIEATYNEAFPDITIPQKEYNVTLNYNGSTTPNTTLKSKNTFDGYWSQRNGKGTKYYDGIGKGIGVSKFTSNSTIYASWINGSITLPDASRPGYKLTGWYTAASGGTKVGNAGAKYNASKNVTLYAQWKLTDAVLNTGRNFNYAIKKLANPNSEKIGVYDYDSNIKNITISRILPGNNVTKIDVSIPNSDVPIYAWFDNGTIYLYSENTKIYLNPNCNSMFSYLSKIESIDLSIFDSSKVVYLSEFIYRTGVKTINLSGFNTTNVTSMYYMFYNNSNLTSLDVSHFDTSNVTSMAGMFAYNSNLTGLDVSHFDTSNVTNMSSMFSNCEGLTSINIKNFNTSNVTNMSSMFYGMKNLVSLDVSHFDTRKVTNMASMFQLASKLSTIDVSNFDTSNVTNMAGMFRYMWGITSLNLKNFDTSNVTSMADMFAGLYLTSLDIRHFNTSKVTNMAGMFDQMYYLKSIDVSHFDTSNVTNMSGMFGSNWSMEYLNLSNFNTSKVEDMSAMFYNMHTLKTIDLSPLDTSKVTNMSGMFAGMSGLTSIDLRPLNTSKVTNMSGMFSEMTNLKSLDLSPLDTSKVNDISFMFYRIDNIEILDLSTLDFSSVVYTNSFYRQGYGAGTRPLTPSVFTGKKLKTIYVSSSFALPKLDKTTVLFHNCPLLTGGRGTKFDSTNNTAEYARIDGVGGPGYLTRK